MTTSPGNVNKYEMKELVPLTIPLTRRWLKPEKPENRVGNGTFEWYRTHVTLLKVSSM